MRHWVEISALEHGHGGKGWELGAVLWSPASDRKNKNRYRIMRVPQVADVVFHLIKEGNERFLVGRSTVRQRLTETMTEPPEPGGWAGFRSYFRIELAHYTEFERIDLKYIQELHAEEIRSDILPNRPMHHPFATYGEGVRLAQGMYLGLLTNKMTEIFSMYSGGTGSERQQDFDVVAYSEGEQLRGERLFFARNAKLREAALEHYGTVCSGCGFDFEIAYGSLGKGYIEVHHLAPLADAKGSVSTKIADVRPLCSNCHRMVHRIRPTMTIEDLRTIVEKQRHIVSASEG